MLTLLGRPAALCVAALLATTPANAGASDYGFEPVAAEVRKGSGAELAVRLVDKSTGKPVAGAIVFRTRLDMSPDGMGTMTAETVSVSATEPGVYRFRADLRMAGGWALQLMAKVQGELETVQGAVAFRAK